MTLEEACAALETQGFVRGGLKPGDFHLQDDSDGRGPFLVWNRADVACPFPELVREPAP